MICMSFRAAALLFVASVPAHAVVVTGAVTGGQSLSLGGEFIELDVATGFSVGNNTFQTANLYAFNEDQNITIPSEITVNVGTNPLAGDIVASHYVFFDPGPNTTQQGYVDFDADIFGVATSTSTLSASDFLVPSGVTYLNPGLRGLEAGDVVSIDASNPQRLLVDWFASTPGDYVRVFTMESPGAGNGNGEPGAIPVPAGLPLLASALLLGALIRRRP
jgi:hypothetical protein